MRKGFDTGISSLLLGMAMMLATACGNDPLPVADADIRMDGPMCTGTIAFSEVCTADAECMSCRCVLFGHQKHCTLPCDGPEDCPAPSTGCVRNRCELPF